MTEDERIQQVRQALVEAADSRAALAWADAAEFDVVPGLVEVLLDHLAPLGDAVASRPGAG